MRGVFLRLLFAFLTIGFLSIFSFTIVSQSTAQYPPVMVDFDSPKEDQVRVSTTSRNEATQVRTISQQEYITETWRTGIMGTGIGFNGLMVEDLDQDGIVDIVAGAGSDFGQNRFWYVLNYNVNNGGYDQKWLSKWYDTYIRRLLIADVAGDGNYSIFVALEDLT